MRVAKWYNNRDIRIEEMPTPIPGPGEMLVKVMACGICGSDVVEWYRLPRAPLVQGHEIGAEVVAVGSAVHDYAPGDRLFIAPKVPCMQCSYCQDGHFPVCSAIKERLPGGFAEHILVPRPLIEHGTYRLTEHLTFEQSTFIEPLACVVRAERLAGVRKGQTILVMGCGMSGLLHVKLAKSRGCRVVATDVTPKKRALAEANGADLVVDAADDVFRRLTDGDGKKADVVILATSALSAVEQAWQCVDKGGAVVFFSVPDPEKTVTVPLNRFWTQEVRILTSYYCGPPDIIDAMALLEKGVIETHDLITHRLPLKDIAEGFRLVLEGRESIKVIIEPNRAD
jgi:L-iditol 2-dehydrogenase